MKPTMSRVWAMPSADTFSIPPIAEFIARWTVKGITIDPFARNSTLADITNDLSPATSAMYHLEATAFAEQQYQLGVRAQRILFDPPYSLRQITEVYQAVGIKPTGREMAAGHKSARDALNRIASDDCIALSFGWNSAGFGKERGYEIQEILLVAHGGAHNDTICVAERRISPALPWGER